MSKLAPLPSMIGSKFLNEHLHIGLFGTPVISTKLIDDFIYQIKYTRLILEHQLYINYDAKSIIVALAFLLNLAKVTNSRLYLIFLHSPGTWLLIDRKANMSYKGLIFTSNETEFISQWARHPQKEKEKMKMLNFLKCIQFLKKLPERYLLKSHFLWYSLSSLNVI